MKDDNNFKMKQIEASFDWHAMTDEVINKRCGSPVDLTMVEIVKQSALNFVDVVFNEGADDSVIYSSQCDFTGDFESLRTKVTIQDVVVSTSDEDAIEFFEETIVGEMFNSDGTLADDYKIRKDKAKEIVDLLRVAIEKVEAIESECN